MNPIFKEYLDFFLIESMDMKGIFGIFTKILFSVLQDALGYGNLKNLLQFCCWIIAYDFINNYKIRITYKTYIKVIVIYEMFGI